MTDSECVAGQSVGASKLCVQKAKHKGFLFFFFLLRKKKNHNKLAHTDTYTQMLTVAKMKLKK